MSMRSLTRTKQMAMRTRILHQFQQRNRDARCEYCIEHDLTTMVHLQVNTWLVVVVLVDMCRTTV
jgi:hypothetical protein